MSGVVLQLSHIAKLFDVRRHQLQWLLGTVTNNTERTAATLAPRQCPTVSAI